MNDTDPIQAGDVMWLWAIGGAAAAAVSLFFASPARADRIENGVAVFAGLDKVTARIQKFEVELGKSTVFGPLKVTPRACYSRPSTETPKTTTFVEVEEVQLDGSEKRIFTGWMFAESPGLQGVEHPTADVWLSECKAPTKATAERAQRPRPQGAGLAGRTGGDAGEPATGQGGDPAQSESGAVSETATPTDEPPLESRRRVRR